MALSSLSPKLLDRFLLTELLDYFLLGVVIFSLIAFFSDALLSFIQDIQKFGISLPTALTLIGLQLPKTVALVLPASSFLAVLMVFNNLSSTLQIIAIRMNGISLRRLIVPALALGLFSSISAYVLGDYVVPYCNKQSELLKQQALRQGSLPIGRESFMFNDYDDNHNLRQMIYVGKYEGNKLADSTIIDLTRPNLLQVIQSKSGTWHPDRWEFENANAYTVSKKTDLMVFNHLGKFTIKNLLNRDEAEEEAQENKRTEQGRLVVNSDTQPFWTLLNTIQQREALGMRVAKSSYMKLWEKVTLPLSCLILILTAVPLALSNPRQASNRGFIFALVILFLSYMLRSVFFAIGPSLTLGGMIPLPTALMLAAWMPLVIMSAIGLTLLARKSNVL